MRPYDGDGFGNVTLFHRVIKPDMFLMRFRDGAAEAVVPVRFVPLVPDEEDQEE